MGDENRDYVVLTRVDSHIIRSILRAPNLQEATRKSLKLIPPRVGYQGINVHEVGIGVTEDA